MRYSEGFRNSVLRKVLPPESRGVYVVAKEMGVSPMTVQNWLAKVKDGKIVVGPEGGEPTPSGRGAAEKLRLLLEGRTLTEDQKGDWLRRHGMHTEHLTLWEQELEGIVTDKQQTSRRNWHETRRPWLKHWPF